MNIFAHITCPNCLTQYDLTERIIFFWEQFPSLDLHESGIILCPYCANPITIDYTTKEYWLTNIDHEVDDPDSIDFIIDLQTVGLRIGIEQLYRSFRPERN